MLSCDGHIGTYDNDVIEELRFLPHSIPYNFTCTFLIQSSSGPVSCDLTCFHSISLASV